MRDTEAVASIVAGDPDGLATAYDRYADPLFTYCQSLLGDTAEAADAVQDTFVIAAARLNGLDDPQRLRAWLFAVARGECLRVLRSRTRARTPRAARDVTGDAGGATHADDTVRAGAAGNPGAAGSDDEQAGQTGLRALFEHAAAGLGPAGREVVELRLRQGLDPAETATVLGVSRGRAQILASRATDELETCLAVLLVGRSGRDECAELGSLLAGWDGRLSAALTKRAGRHIARCSACGARRAVELRPSALLELAPAAALAAGAAESFRQAAGAPADLRAHTIALATGGGSASAAHATAVLTRAGTFGRQGFPKPAHARGADGPAGGGAGWSRPGFPSSPQGRAAVAAAVVLAVGAAVTGFALSNGQHPAPSADPKPTVSSADPLAATGSAASSAAARASTAVPAASGRSSAARASTPAAVTVTQTAATTPATVPATAGASQSPSVAPTTASPSATASAAPTAGQPAGTLRVFPGGGSIFLVPGGRGALLFLSASGGAVDWSVSVSGDPGHTITVSPGTSGTLTATQPHVTLEISASRSLSCGGGTPCPTITIEPGGTVLTVTTSGRRHPFSHRRRQHRHDGLPAAALLGPPAGGSTVTPPAGGSTVGAASGRQHRHAACRRQHCTAAPPAAALYGRPPAPGSSPMAKAPASTCTHNNAFIKRYRQSWCRRATNPLR